MHKDTEIPENESSEELERRIHLLKSALTVQEIMNRDLQERVEKCKEHIKSLELKLFLARPSEDL